jgi:hypothetical protein
MSQQVSKETSNYATGKKQAWRGPNQAAEQYLTSDVRWEDAAVHAQAKVRKISSSYAHLNLCTFFEGESGNGGRNDCICPEPARQVEASYLLCSEVRPYHWHLWPPKARHTT